MRMRVLSLHQPWASLMAWGQKTIETRSWSTNYRGPLAIHAAKTIPAYAREAMKDQGIVQALVDGPGIKFDVTDKPGGGTHIGPGATVDLPTGAIVAIVNLVDVAPTIDLLFDPPGINRREQTLGDYTAGRYGWRCNNLIRLAEPIEHRGGQGLRWYDLPDAAIEALSPHQRQLLATATAVAPAPTR